METPVKFNWIECATFGSLLGISALIGIYYGCIKGNQNTVAEYMLGGKNMQILPIAISLVASHISGVTLLGYPAEIYEFGTQFMMQVLGTVALVYITNTFYLPVFYDLQLKSVFEYLELRFSSKVRKMCSFLYASSLIMNIPMVIYIPALAIHEVSGINLHLITPLICSLCIFYTTIGGFKTVVWTDTIQGIFTFFVTATVITLGIVNVGGLKEVYDANARSDRWEFFNFSLNPFTRMTFWSAIIGSLIAWTVGLTIHPGSTQRFYALPSKKAAQWSVVWFSVGAIILTITASLAGVVMYAHYEGCDPLKTKVEIHKSGELLPHYVQEIAFSYPGLTGLFLSGLMSTALSYMSAGLNTVAGVVYEDFFIHFMPSGTTEWMASFIMKITIVIIGTICVALVYLLENLDSITQVSHSLGASQNGAAFAAFALGLFFPRANTKGVFGGTIISIICMTWIVVGAQIAILKRRLVYVGKSTSVDNCSMNFNISTIAYSNFTEIAKGVFIAPDLNPIFALSFYYYTPMGALIGISVGLIVSWATGGSDLNKINPALITPPLRNRLKQLEYEKYSNQSNTELEFVENTMKTI